VGKQKESIRGTSSGSFCSNNNNMTNVDFGKFSWWYWIVAFVVVVVILLIIVIGVCMHRCKVHQERARQGNNNGTGGLDEPILDADDMEALITSV